MKCFFFIFDFVFFFYPFYCMIVRLTTVCAAPVPINPSVFFFHPWGTWFNGFNLQMSSSPKRSVTRKSATTWTRLSSNSSCKKVHLNIVQMLSFRKTKNSGSRPISSATHVFFLSLLFWVLIGTFLFLVIFVLSVIVYTTAYKYIKLSYWLFHVIKSGTRRVLTVLTLQMN